MEDNYSIDEILSAVDDLQNFKSSKTKKVSKVLNQLDSHKKKSSRELKFRTKI